MMVSPGQILAALVVGALVAQPTNDELGLQVRLLGRLDGSEPGARLQLAETAGESASQLLVVEYRRSSEPVQAVLSWLTYRDGEFDLTPVSTHETKRPITVARRAGGSPSVAAIGWPWNERVQLHVPDAEPLDLEGAEGTALGRAICTTRDGVYVSSPAFRPFVMDNVAPTRESHRSSAVWRIDAEAGLVPLVRHDGNGLGRHLAAYSASEILIGSEGSAAREHGFVALWSPADEEERWAYRYSDWEAEALHVMGDLNGDGHPEVAAAYRTDVGLGPTVLDGRDGHPIWMRTVSIVDEGAGLTSLTSPRPLLAFGGGGRVELFEPDGAPVESITVKGASGDFGERLGVLMTDTGEILVVSDELASRESEFAGALYLFEVSDA